LTRRNGYEFKICHVDFARCTLYPPISLPQCPMPQVSCGPTARIHVHIKLWMREYTQCNDLVKKMVFEPLSF
jgi:hypothetical protein